MSEEIILEARDIWHSYEENDRFSLQGLDLKVKKGSKVAFMGANGSGKSTFFLCCNGISVSYTHLTLPTNSLV